MTPERFSEVLALCEAGDAGEDGYREFTPKATLSLYVNHGNATVVAASIEAIAQKGLELRARTSKGEVWFIDLADVFAASVDGRVSAKSARKAGFA
jgi:hypothetical protein